MRDMEFEDLTDSGKVFECKYMGSRIPEDTLLYVTITEYDAQKGTLDLNLTLDQKNLRSCEIDENKKEVSLTYELQHTHLSVPSMSLKVPDTIERLLLYDFSKP